MTDILAIATPRGVQFSGCTTGKSLFLPFVSIAERDGPVVSGYD